MRSALYAFAADLAGEGVEAVLDNVERRAGAGGVLLAAAYHDARDVFPHNPLGVVRSHGGGLLSFHPDRARWRGVPLEPRVSPLARDTDLLAELCAAASRRGLDVYAWTVLLHADRDDARELATRNAFGDPSPTDLCPTNPAARTYVRALVSDVSRYELRAVVAESLHFHPFEHGGHHERAFVPLNGRVRFLLGLCFCEHCLALARRYGVDAEAVRRFARSEVGRALAGEGPAAPPPASPLSRAEAEGMAGGELAGYLRARAESVTSLVAEAAEEAAAEGVGLAFMDPGGAVKGYADGRPAGGPACEASWSLGVDLAALARHCDGVEVLAYATDPARVRLDLDAYRALLPTGCRLGVGLRPMWPDCDSAENLREKVAAAAAAGTDRVDFYHYGLAPLAALDRVRAALA